MIREIITVGLGGAAGSIVRYLVSYGLLAGHIDTIISRSREISLEDLKRQSLPVKLRNAACWIFSPYL